jgi:hypothetical protein
MSLSETFQEHVEEYGWSADQRTKVLLEFLDQEVKWNIFADYLSDNYPLTYPPEKPLTPEQQARAKERQQKLVAARCLLVLTADSESVGTYWFPTTFPHVIEQIRKKAPGTYILTMGDKDEQPVCFDDGEYVLRKEIVV